MQPLLDLRRRCGHGRSKVFVVLRHRAFAGGSLTAWAVGELITLAERRARRACRQVGEYAAATPPLMGHPSRVDENRGIVAAARYFASSFVAGRQRGEISGTWRSLRPYCPVRAFAASHPSWDAWPLTRRRRSRRPEHREQALGTMAAYTVMFAAADCPRKCGITPRHRAMCSAITLSASAALGSPRATPAKAVVDRYGRQW